jgi:membrane-bound serine protease (ClpP class)
MDGISRRKARRRFDAGLALLAAACFALVSQVQSAAYAGSESHAVLIPVTGAIGPATSDFFVRQLKAAEQSGAHIVVLRLDTPGGLETAMRDMIQAILASNVPVIAFVAPSGARAASAGTYLMYASHVAAMAPATNLGAATPIAIGGSSPDTDNPPTQPADPGTGDKRSKSKPLPVAPSNASERKAVNDSVAYLRGLAELRGRNVDWAERAVREGASLPAAEALTANVIDLIATDLPGLLRAIDGRVVKLQSREITLATTGLVLREVQPDWRTELLQLVTNPNVAYLLLLIGIYGLLLEGYNPGSVLPGVVGAICLLLALFAFQVLSVNYAGLALIALGVLLIVAESFVPSFGTLGLGGIVAFIIGSVLLLDSDVPGFDIAWPLIGSMGLVSALVLTGIVSFAVHARSRPVVSGREAMLVEFAEAVEAFDRQGPVRVHGELWHAVTQTPVQAGERLRIIKVDGLTLEVEPDRS